MSGLSDPFALSSLEIVARIEQMYEVGGVGVDIGARGPAALLAPYLRLRCEKRLIVIAKIGPS